jgi:hypothetical protein
VPLQQGIVFLEERFPPARMSGEQVLRELRHALVHELDDFAAVDAWLMASRNCRMENGSRSC